MDFDPGEARRLISRESLRPELSQFLISVDAIAQVVGVSSTLLAYGLGPYATGHWELGVLTFLSMLVISVGVLIRLAWSLTRRSFRREYRYTLLATFAWIVGLIVVTILAPAIDDVHAIGTSRWPTYVLLSEAMICLYAASGVIRGLRFAASGGVNPALLLAASFLVWISVGTGVLMLPRCRAAGNEVGGAPFTTALFTSTSASCVTGLVVEDTRTYWSPLGQFAILLQFQIGGLGIMTFGAFFALVNVRNIPIREHATLSDLLATDGLSDLRRVVSVIVGSTILAELTGAILLMSLWPELPLLERFWMGLFHSVSAFCNAGFALTPDSFVGMAHRWQVWGVLSGLIIAGGLGFTVLEDLLGRTVEAVRTRLRPRILKPGRRRRLTLTSYLVLVTTFGLLVVGTVLISCLERIGPPNDPHAAQDVSDAWFQSVTFRTAGFNTCDLGALRPSTKLVAIALMFIGASPGSTGGGVKTTVFAMALLGLITVLRNREAAEVRQRRIPVGILNRALAVLVVGTAAVMTTTMLLTIFEQRPQHFIDYLFEATSAAGTVGVSSTIPHPDGTVTSVTQSLSTPSRFVIIVAMFLGRIGPLTLLMAMAGRPTTGRYEYPLERVSLG
ncbi:MAG: potassium transporter TrkG [Planctomycetaceae bacterium]